MASQLHINRLFSACVGICCSDTNWELTGIDVLCVAYKLSWPYEEFMTKHLRACAHRHNWNVEEKSIFKYAFIFFSAMDFDTCF